MQPVSKLSIHPNEEKFPQCQLQPKALHCHRQLLKQRLKKSDEEFTQIWRKYSKTGSAINLVISSKLSTPKAATVCRQLFQDGINVETPSESGIYRSTVKEAVKFLFLSEENTIFRKLVIAFLW